MEFLNPLGLLGLLGIPILYLLFLFRQRRLTREFPSLLLWQKTASRMKAFPTRSFRWFEPILLLQFLAILLFSLALGDPILSKSGFSPRKIAVVVDLSASMKATDSQGKGRYQSLREEAQKAMDSLSPQDKTALFFCPSIDKNILWETPAETLKKIKNHSPLWRSGNIEEDLLFLQNRYPDIDGWLVFTDKRGEKGNYVSVGNSVENGAITHLAARRIGGSTEAEVLVEVANFSPSSKTYELKIKGEKKQSHSLPLLPWERKKLFLPLHLSSSLLFELHPLDAFPWDNQGGISFLHGKIEIYYSGSSQDPLFFALKASGKFHLVSRPEMADICFSLGEIFSTRVPLLVQFPSPSGEKKFFSSPIQKESNIVSSPELQKIFPSFLPISFSVKSFFPITPMPHLKPLFLGPGNTWAGAWGKKEGQEFWIFGFEMNKKNTAWVENASFPHFWSLFAEKHESRFSSLEAYSVGKKYFLSPSFQERSLTTPSGKIIPWPSPFTPEEVGIYTLEKGMEKGLFPVNFSMPEESNLFSSYHPFETNMLPTMKKMEFRPYSLKKILLILLFFVILFIWYLRSLADKKKLSPSHPLSSSFLNP